jgi:hypothetical protein
MTDEHIDPYEYFESPDAKKTNKNEASSTDYTLKAAGNLVNESSSESMEISDYNSVDETENNDPENKKA